jgi:neurotransmitter:Na+ symporter, NSS family
MSSATKKEAWNSRIGVIFAVAGSAVGLGNFLRFPGQAAEYGGGAFMIAYFISLLLIGIPICWAEWTMGRLGGKYGFNSCPGIFHAIVQKPAGKYLGVFGVLIPVVIYMYYVYIEAWCLGYAVYFLTGQLNLGDDVAAYGDFWARFIGAERDGSALGFGWQNVSIFLLIVFVFNFFLIYRGLSKGIEFFCKYAMPALIFLALIVLVRVLTLGAPIPEKPEQSILNGLGYLWNPGNLALQLRNPQLWLAAAGQIFFSLSVGFGVIITYASYLNEKDDIVLSGLTATSANEFCEVSLGGLITVPAAFAFLGAAGIVGQGTFGLGFKVLPLVFAKMPFGELFGAMFFFLLFLAAVTSSLSMLQPGIAFLEESLNLNRKQSVALLGLITGMGTLFVVYFSENVKALDTIDFWVGTFLLFVLATIEIILFSWVIGIDKSWKEAHKGAAFRIPNFFKVIMKYICPLYLLTIFSFWVLFNVFGWDPATGAFEPTGYALELVGSATVPPNPVARASVGLIIIVVVFLCLIISISGKRWEKLNRRL